MLQRLNISHVAGAVFIAAGIVTAILRDLLASATWFALAASFLLMEPPASVPEENNPTRRRMQFRASWRNLVSLGALVVGIVFFTIQLVRDIG